MRRTIARRQPASPALTVRRPGHHLLGGPRPRSALASEPRARPLRSCSWPYGLTGYRPLEKNAIAQPATLNPWQEKGIPLESQYKSWYGGLHDPYVKQDVDAYTRCRIILMNGIENEVILFSHTFARTCGDPAIRALLAQTRMVEHQQQTAINWLNPADQSILETTIAFEQVAVDLTAYLARHEPDPYVREVFNFGLLEDFDHLYRYSELEAIQKSWAVAEDRHPARAACVPRSSV